MTEQVKFSAMKDGTYEDYQILARMEEKYVAGLPAKLLRELRYQEEETLNGYKISRLEHALQSATRAYRDQACEDWIVAALLHDIGDGLAPKNHDKIAAEIMRPYMREEIVWVIEHHGIFQTYYFGHHYGWDKNARDMYKEHPYYQTCIDFCEYWDQTSFDPEYKSETLEFFSPMVHRVFSREAYKENVLQNNQKLGLWP